MLSTYDYVVLVFYFGFMLVIGWVFRSMNKNSSDYFRGSGAMVWWLVGASAFMQQFSAWTFTAGAGKAFTDGWIILVIYVANAAGYFFNFAWFGARFRQMRLITAIQAVRERFDPANEQFFTWVGMPINIIGGALQLNGLAVFFAAAFGFDLAWTILIVGGVVVFMTVAGGSWAVVAGDFIQALLLMVISVVMAVSALGHAGIGGISGFMEKSPSRYTHWFEQANPEIIYVWILAMFINQFVRMNNMTDASRYLCVKDGNHARRAALLACGLMALGPICWFIPPMVAGILQPDIAAHFPALKTPAEAAYVYAGGLVLPAGMLGLMLCGIFAATMAAMDAGLNRNAGIVIKNFYQPVLKPHATEEHLLVASKFVTLVLGILIILVTIYMSKLKGLSLFDLMFLFTSIIALPYAMPLLWGMLVKRTPAWSGWSTVVVGFASAYVLNRYLDLQLVWRLLGHTGILTAREKLDLNVVVGVFGNVLVCTAWFFFTKLFYKQTPAEYRNRVEAFFTRMSTPVDFQREMGAGSDGRQAHMLGVLTLVYGGFIAAAALLVPQSTSSGRWTFLVSGVAMLAVGMVLYAVGRRIRLSSTSQARAAPSPDEPKPH